MDRKKVDAIFEAGVWRGDSVEDYTGRQNVTLFAVHRRVYYITERTLSVSVRTQV